MTRSTSGLALALLGVVACRAFPPEMIVSECPEGILPQYVNLRSEWYDYDSSAVSFSYEIPASARDTAIEQLRRQIHRPAARGGAPTESCFEVLKQTADYLLTSCRETSGYQSTGAWEVRLIGDRINVITGPPDVMLNYLIVGEAKKGAGR